MKVVTTIEETTSIITSLQSSNKTIGLTPTMGALHEGHLSLIQKSCKQNEISIVTIFVNPTQFDKKEDLINYPSSYNSDIKLLENTSCDYVFAPKPSEMYQQDIEAETFTFDGLENEMEGKFRNNHFDGVGTIVKKFFQIIKPSKAYFGEKDFQQLQIIKKMTTKEMFPVEIIGCPIFRESDGLAMSSRNARLSENQRQAAPLIFEILKKVKDQFKTKSILEINSWVSDRFKESSTLTLEYFEIADESTLKTISKRENQKKHRAFIAVYADKIRLIDNISLQ